MKLALITGGAKRLGRVVTQALAETGHHCLIHANTSAAEAANLCAELSSQGVNAQHCLHAIEDPVAAADFLLDTSLELFGQLPTCSVLSAASYSKDDPNQRLADQISKQLDLNFLFPVAFCTAMAERISTSTDKASPPPSVILFTDYKVEKINSDYFSYSIAKHALDGVMQFLTVAHAKKLRVNAIAPGPISSHDMSTEELASRVEASTISGRSPADHEIGQTAAYLANCHAIYGQQIFVDAGARFEANTRELSLGVAN
jgi:NAD(P)-dependent dehydrogenase (short-subunit alcohol dehydrogenase family)